MRTIIASPWRRCSGAVLLALAATMSIAACEEETSDSIEGSGTIERREVTVSPVVGGIITRLHVDEGSIVRAGDTLAEIDDTDYQLQRDQLLAGLDMTRAQYEGLTSGARSEDIAQAEEGVRQAKALLDDAADNLRRLEQVQSAGGITDKAVAEARTRVAVARSAHRSAQLMVTRLRSGSRSEELRAGRARNAQAEAQLKIIDKKIRDCTVLAPVDGVVNAVVVEKGELAIPGGGLMTIARTGDVELAIYLPEGDLAFVSLGDQAEVVPEFEGATPHKGRVTFISPSAEFTPKNVQTKEDRMKQVFEVRVTVADPSGDLKPGLTADVRIRRKGAAVGKK